MTEFTDKFQQLLEKIADIQIKAAETNGSVNQLKESMGYESEAFKQHLCDAGARERAINGIKITLVLQIIAFSFMCGGLVWNVNNNTKRLDRIEKTSEVFKHYISSDDMRWRMTEEQNKDR